MTTTTTTDETYGPKEALSDLNTLQIYCVALGLRARTQIPYANIRDYLKSLIAEEEAT